jgi:hypothetical protein
MKNNKTVIKIRKGCNGFKYSACDQHGNFLRNFRKLSDVRKHWKNEIKWGHVELVRELDKEPDFTAIRDTARIIGKLLENI